MGRNAHKKGIRGKLSYVIGEIALNAQRNLFCRQIPVYGQIVLAILRLGHGPRR